SNRHAVEMHGAGTSQSHPATKFGAGHGEMITQHPQQRGVRRGVDIHGLIVHPYVYHAAIRWRPETPVMLASPNARKVDLLSARVRARCGCCSGLRTDQDLHAVLWSDGLG